MLGFDVFKALGHTLLVLLARGPARFDLPRVLLLALACACGLACEPETTPATQVVVHVRSDFADELVKVEVELYDEAEQHKGGTQAFQVSAQDLPFFTVVPPANSTRDSFVILLRGRDAAGGTVETKSVVKFLKRQTLELQMWLLRGCRDKACSVGEACAATVGGGAACQPTALAMTTPLDPDSLAVDGAVVGVEPISVGERDAAAGMSPRDASQSTTGDGGGGVAGGGGSDSGPALDAGKDAGLPREAGATVGGTIGGIGGTIGGSTGSDSGAGSFGPDGDPSGPVLALPEVGCRGSQGTNLPNFAFNGREVILEYPCNKHEGAELTVILNLHGTISDPAGKFYLRDLFPAHRELINQNLIVVTPVSAAAQWGNGDGATDLPYLTALVDWVYQRFAKTNIRALWIAGHSWGGLYAGRIYCDAALKDRVRGLLIMTGGLPATTSTCLSRISVITTRAMADPAVDQSNLATLHHCTVPAAGPELLATNNERRYYNGCDSPFVHEEYTLNGKTLTDTLDPAVVTKIVDAIKRSTR